MSTPIDNEKYPPSGDGAKLPGLASPSTDINQLRNVVDNLKEIVEIREGRRGSRYDQVVTWRDLYNVGLVAVQSGGNTFINRTGSGGVAGVTLLSPNLQAMMAEEFDRKVKASGAYKDLTTEIGVAAAYKGAPQEVVDILTNNLLDEAIKRGADIRNVETKIQEIDRSLALSVRELTASVDGAQASAREVMYSSATRDQATAGVVTTVKARLDNFGGGGVTVEQKMTATVNRVTGLEGIYSVKVVIDNNGTPYITGFALSSTVTAGGGATSSFVVNASNFAIYRPGTSSVAPFGVDAGTNTVFINGTLLINSGGTSINSVSATATAANGTANSALGTANSANGTATSAYNLAFSADANATNAINSVANKLSKAGNEILTGPISLQTNGAIVVGNSTNGVAMGVSGIIGRKNNNTTFSIAADGSAVFSGDIDTSGKLNLVGAGFANAQGNQSVQYVQLSSGNSSKTSIQVETPTGGNYGIWSQARGNSNAIVSAADSGSALIALSVSGVAISSISLSASAAVSAVNQGGGPGLSTSTFRWGNYTYSAPVGSGYYLQDNGNWSQVAYATSAGTASIASLAYDSNALGGVAASNWTRIFVTNYGTANAGGAGINLIGDTYTGIAGAYVHTSGTSNVVTWTVQTTSPSDIRLKEEISNSDLGLTFLKQLRPVSYKLKADPKHQKGYGFIADEVEEILGLNSSLVYFEPDWQVGSERGFKTIHYPSYVAILTKAIQELSAEVETLKARV
jgi:hypothetical protein